MSRVLKDCTPAHERSVLPNILVYIDVREGRPTAPSLFAVAEARRIARLGGASIFAVVLSAPLGTDELDRLARPVAEAGADKLLLCEASDFAGPPRDVTHGRGLDAAAARVPPMLVLFPAGGAGAALGPPLAARLSGPFVPWCDFLTTAADIPAVDGEGRVQLIRCRPDSRSRDRLDPLRIERTIVATVGAGQRGRPSGRIQDLEIEVVAIVPRPSQPGGNDFTEREREPDPHAHLSLASLLVLIGDGVDGAPLLSAEQLRDALPPESRGEVAVANARDIPFSVLGACCPDILLRVGPSAARVGRSPRGRVVLATVSAALTDTMTDTVTDDVDILWQFASFAHLSVQAVAALVVDVTSAGAAPQTGAG
ncbi:MAG: hypothetical protein ABJA82_05775 [Myxococcales bacterium]